MRLHEIWPLLLQGKQVKRASWNGGYITMKNGCVHFRSQKEDGSIDLDHCCIINGLIHDDLVADNWELAHLVPGDDLYAPSKEVRPDTRFNREWPL